MFLSCIAPSDCRSELEALMFVGPAVVLVSDWTVASTFLVELMKGPVTCSFQSLVFIANDLITFFPWIETYWESSYLLIFTVFLSQP